MPTLSRTQGRLPVPVLAAVAFLEPMPYRSQRSAILGKRVAKHGQAAGRGLTRHFVLDDVPVLFEQPVFHSYGVHHDPWGGQAVSGEPTAEEDHVALGHDQLRLIGELGWQRLDEPEEAIAPGRDVCTVLDVPLSPESLGCGVVPLVEQGVERLAHDGLVSLIYAVSHRRPSCLVEPKLLTSWTLDRCPIALGRSSRAACRLLAPEDLRAGEEHTAVGPHLEALEVVAVGRRGGLAGQHRIVDAVVGHFWRSERHARRDESRRLGLAERHAAAQMLAHG